MEYFDPQKNWPRIYRYLKMPIVRKTLTRDFNKFTLGRWNQKFTDENVPAEFESCDWTDDRSEELGMRGRNPAYWRYVKHAASHRLVNFNLRLAEQVEPERTWCIV